MRRSQRRSDRGGVVSVEFALVAPLVFLFFFAQLEFSRANMVRHALKTACYEGCRTGIVLGATAEDIEASARQTLDSVGVHHYTITVTPSVVVPETRDVSVQISAPIAENSWMMPFFLRDAQVENSMTMEREMTDQTIF